MKCAWALSHPLLEEYHDHEWGNPVHEDRKHFEFFVMDLFQAGLSWLTILKKREGFREALDNFEFRKIARYDENKIQELLGNEKIIRNKLKVRATIHNAQRFLEVIEEFDCFDNYIWSFTEGRTLQNSFREQNQIPASTELSDRISKDLKRRDFKFVGSTIIYAYMQAAGMVNDHIISCPRHTALKNN